MNIRTTNSCCGVKEICELREHLTPEEALKVFLEQSFTEQGEYKGGNLYLFDGIREWTEGYVPGPEPTREQYDVKEWRLEIRQMYYEKAVAAHKKEQRFGYAFAFAKYLKKHDLGPVVRAPLRQNRNYLKSGGGHLTEAYLWAPDVEKLIQLWNEWKLKGKFDKYA